MAVAFGKYRHPNKVNKPASCIKNARRSRGHFLLRRSASTSALPLRMEYLCDNMRLAMASKTRLQFGTNNYMEIHNCQPN
jgi:hypothetical protein